MLPAAKTILFLIVVIVALLSFSLGYMTAKDSTHTPIIIENYARVP